MYRLIYHLDIWRWGWKTDEMSTWFQPVRAGLGKGRRGCLRGRNESHNAITLRGLQPTTSELVGFLAIALFQLNIFTIGWLHFFPVILFIQLFLFFIIIIINAAFFILFLVSQFQYFNFIFLSKLNKLYIVILIWCVFFFFFLILFKRCSIGIFDREKRERVCWVVKNSKRGVQGSYLLTKT